jgi:hypothetical protein
MILVVSRKTIGLQVLERARSRLFSDVSRLGAAPVDIEISHPTLDPNFNLNP